MDTYNLVNTDKKFLIDNAFILGRKAYDIGTRVVKWNEQQGYDGYKRPLKIRPRPHGVDDIKQLLIHHAGQDRRDPGTMYKVLWDQRKLSVHFALDEFAKPVKSLDAGAIIWQFVDCDYICAHAGTMNKTSIGIEVCHFPSAWKDPNYYNQKNNDKKNNVPHQTAKEPVFSKIRKVYTFTDNQVDALARLYAGCWVAIGHQREYEFSDEYSNSPVFPRVPLGLALRKYIPWGAIKDPKEHIGLIAHRHCTKKKWDPAGLNFDSFERLVLTYYYKFRENLRNNE